MGWMYGGSGLHLSVVQAICGIAVAEEAEFAGRVVARFDYLAVESDGVV